MTDKEIIKLTLEQALKLLPTSEEIHTFVNPSASMLIGADWPRDEVIDKIKTFGAELSGEQASKMNHGMCIHDGKKYIFIQTVEVKNE